jgi:hypothetical protein
LILRSCGVGGRHGVVVEDRVRATPGWGIWDRDDARTGLASVWLFFRDLPPAVMPLDVDDRGGGRIGEDSLDASGVWPTELFVDDVLEATLSDAAADEVPEASNAAARRFRELSMDWLASAMPFAGLVAMPILEIWSAHATKLQASGMQPLQNQAKTPNTTKLVCGRRRAGESLCSGQFLLAESRVVVHE